jgi:hypothetical protein
MNEGGRETRRPFLELALAGILLALLVVSRF